MKANARQRAALLLLCLIALCVAACSPMKSDQSFQTFRDIPGITEQEIAAIEALKAARSSFSFSNTFSTEAFLFPDGAPGGFAALFCELLTNLFGIPFIPEFLEWNDLYNGIRNYTVDFTGELTPTPERRLMFYMTSPIAARSLVVMIKEGAVQIQTPEDLNGLRIGFFSGTITEQSVRNLYPALTFEVVDVYSSQEVADKLLAEEIDAFINDSVGAYQFIDYPFISYVNALPLVYTPASFTTANPELQPIITVMEKFIIAKGGNDKLYELYIEGANEFARFLFDRSLTDEEKTFIAALAARGKEVPVALESDNYPISFFNNRADEFQGIAVDILEEISSLTGIKFEIITSRDTSWFEILEMLESNKVALVTELRQTEERRDRFIWPQDFYYSSQFVFLSKVDYPDKEFYRIPHSTVGISRGTVFEEIYETWFPGNTNSILFDTQDHALDALERGEIDLFLTSDYTLNYQINFREKIGYKINILVATIVDKSYFGLNINETILCSIIDKAQNAIDKDRIVRSWTGRVYDYNRTIAEIRLTYTTVLAVVFLVLAAALVIMLIKNSKTKALYKNQMIILSAIYKSVPDLMFCKDKNYAYISCNPSFEKFAGCSEAELIGKTAFEVNGLNERIPCDIINIDKQVLNEGITAKTNDWFTYPDGSKRFVETIKAPLSLNGKVVGLLGIIRDITEFKQAMEVTEKILNSTESMIYVNDPKTGEILFINDSMKQHYGIKDDCAGQLCFKVFQKDIDKRCDFCPCSRLDKEPDKIIVWEEHSTLTNRIYRNIDRYIDWPGGQKVHMQHSVDMTELIAAKNLAEQSSHYKSVFLATMSHEIRTPMNAILGIAEIHMQDKAISPQTMEAFNKIFESGDLLLNIINDILDFSKIEAGKLELTPVKYDIPDMIDDIVEINCVRFDGKPIQVVLNVDVNTPVELFGDEFRIKQILNNILSNAFKYTDEGEIEFSVSAEPDQNNQNDTITLVFCVKDSGQGMTEEQVNEIFDEFVRFNLNTNRTTIGTGLGMSIAKRLIDLMNGKITVKSKPGEGSAFTVYLPQKLAGSAVCGEKIARELQNFNYKNMAMSKRTSFLREYMPYGSALVVDDIVSNIYVTKGMLHPYGLKIETVCSGFEAIDKIKNGAVYDIIFMDHMMPQMDGIETTKRLRAMGYTNNIIALTANALIGQEEKFLQNGFDGFIPKPIDSRELNALLNNLIRDKKQPEVVEAARREQRKENTITTFENLNSNELFVLDAENALNTLEKLYAKIDTLDDAEINSYIISVHGMKSALANINENELSAIARKLEQAGEERNFAVMLSETPVFINAIKSLAAKLKPVEKNGAAGTSNEEPISEENRDYLQKKLLEIKTACLAFNKITANAALNDLKQKTWPHHIKTVLEKISLDIFHSAFKKAAAEAENAINSVNNPV